MNGLFYHACDTRQGDQRTRSYQSPLPLSTTPSNFSCGNIGVISKLGESLTDVFAFTFDNFELELHTATLTTDRKRSHALVARRRLSTGARHDMRRYALLGCCGQVSRSIRGLHHFQTVSTMTLPES
ncbi:hypothetical protein DAEQUDRAFT_245039 [Daedalea quercina L-15889]|uniref:Uncharacterized protein n=1 Tax=Daedalea quercina L-15889 TaxID=1314783 RepID=A0A165KG00_9APHY|nr:hypothetical protein DAEQUDRAFT_245039 [Daedalea quercina L-15889]